MTFDTSQIKPFAAWSSCVKDVDSLGIGLSSLFSLIDIPAVRQRE
jgi:hypothetical protein